VFGYEEASCICVCVLFVARTVSITDNGTKNSINCSAVRTTNAGDATRAKVFVRTCAVEG
jgi:hypothetical protein